MNVFSTIILSLALLWPVVSHAQESVVVMDGGLRPLHSAAYKSSPEIVKLLLDRGAMIEAKTEGGRTPLHLAALSTAPGRPEVVIVLLDHGADISAVDGKGLTAFDYATINKAFRGTEAYRRLRIKHAGLQGERFKP